MADTPQLISSASRRAFIARAVGAATTLTLGTAALAAELPASGQDPVCLTEGDAAILRFLSAAEIIESDLWQQYAELGGVTSGDQNNYQLALQFLDSDGSQYVTSNTIDEISHFTFLNAYLESKGVAPVNLDQFRTLPSSKAKGARQVGRLTNLGQLTVDTSWYVRYRSAENPDFGATFPQAISIVGRPAIPLDDTDFENPERIQVIANTAAFHFGFIEQGGSSLYATMSRKVTSLEVERIVVSIGGVETHHFGEWMDFAGNTVQGPPYSFAGATSPVSDDGLKFPDFTKPPFNTRLLQPNLIFPVPTQFISKGLPLCSVIRPTSEINVNATGAIDAFVNDGLFIGQSQQFLEVLYNLAAAADIAQPVR